jgi:hypothetical protein
MQQLWRAQGQRGVFIDVHGHKPAVYSPHCRSAG